MTRWPGRQAERTAGRQIARARNQRGVVPMRLTHAPGKQRRTPELPTSSSSRQ